MKRAKIAAVLLWTSVLLAFLGPELVAADNNRSKEHELDSDDESDSAPFMRKSTSDEELYFNKSLIVIFDYGSPLSQLDFRIAVNEFLQKIRGLIHLAIRLENGGKRTLLSDIETNSSRAEYNIKRAQAEKKIVVEHGNGRRCSGSLVSLRTALTSAWCVRGPHGGNPRELWALSPGVPSIPTASRRVSRVALVAGAELDSPHLQPAWLGAALDIAVLELEAPFGGGTRSRSILMATRPEDCAVGHLCHVVRVRGRSPRLRIVDATLVSGEVCGAVAAGWPSLRDSALCLVGPTLCSIDRGAGVVCEGKLCGVLSRSARLTNESTPAENSSTETTSSAEKRDATCGDTHVALSVARMRRFLHCARTLRACGSGGECSQQCSERQLMVLEARDSDPILVPTESESTTEPTTEQYTVTTEPMTTKIETRLPDTTTSPVTLVAAAEVVPMFKTSKAPPSRSPTPTLTSAKALTTPVSTARPSFEFEPNRADFRAAPARTSRVYLKAGEYGDNALDYSANEDVAAAPTTTTEDTTSCSLLSSAFSSLSGTTSPKHSHPTHTQITDTATTEDDDIVKTEQKGGKLPHVRVSKLDAQYAAQPDAQSSNAEDYEPKLKRSRNMAVKLHCTNLSVLLLLRLY